MSSVLVVGDVMFDILVTPESEARENTDVTAKIVKKPGGSAANFACWFASIASSGQETNLVARVGRSDEREILEDLKSYRINPLLQLDPSLPTGSTVNIIRGNTRSFYTDRGANANLALESIPNELFQDLVYISGYTLMSCPEASLRWLIDTAHNHGTMVACDPGSAGFISDFGPDRFLKVLNGVDLFFPNLEEAKLLSGETHLDDITKTLLESFPLIAVTLGESGAAVAWESHRISAEKIRGSSYRASAIEPYPSDLVDPTGAGDAFAAAFLAEFLVSSDPISSGFAGARLGGLAVSRMGGRPQVPDTPVHL